MKKFFILALSILFIPLNVFAEETSNPAEIPDEYKSAFDCLYVPPQGYSIKPNSSHSSGIYNYNFITNDDVTDGISTSQPFKVGSKMYKALAYKNTFYTDYGTSFAFDMFFHDDFWSHDGLLGVSDWKRNSYYEGFIVLTNFDKTRYTLTPQKVTSQEYAAPGENVGLRMPSVGVLSDDSWINSKANDFVQFVDEEVFYTYVDDNDKSMLATVIYFKFKLTAQTGSHKMILHVSSPDLNHGDVFNAYMLGSYIKTSNSDPLPQKLLSGKVHTPFSSLVFYDDMECYTGSLPSDSSSPDVLECDGVIDCTIKEVTNKIEKFINSLLDFLSALFIPNGDTMSNMCNDFMEWFDEKLGFIGQPITFTIDFLNRFMNLQDTGHYVINVPDIKVPIFNQTIISGFSYDLGSIREDENLKKVHDVYLIIINGTIGIAFLLLCLKTYNDIFGTSDGPNETLSESTGYSIDEDTGEVKTRTSYRHTKTYRKNKYTGKWVGKE